MSLKDVLDRANPNTLADACRTLKLGQTLQQDVKQTIMGLDIHAEGVSPYDAATLDTIRLPDDCKACEILRAWSRVGGAGTGAQTVDAPDATPAVAGHIAVLPTGNIGVLTADACTALDIEFIPRRGDMLEVTLPVVANVLTLPAALTANGVWNLCEAEATAITAGGLIGDHIVDAPGAGPPAAGHAMLNLAKTTVTFPAADLVVEARVKCLCGPATNLNTELQADSDLT